MMSSSSSSSSSTFMITPYLFLVCFLSLSLFLFAESNEVTDIHIGNPVSHLSPSPLVEYSSSHGARDILSCGRVRISGLSRLKFKSYANSFRVTLTPVIPEKFHGKIGICFHRNSSLGLCQCVKDDWGAVHKGNWSTVMSPYANGYLDVKLIDGVSGSITVSVEEEFQLWRVLFLGCGFLLLLLAPIFSNWVPFYYSSSMVIGILLVILVILFQGMKLLPTGRKNVFYLTIYGSLLGVGSFLVQYFSMLINSILLNFGLNEDMYNPVSVFVLVALVLVGAALGYWTVRKFVMSEDGSVDVGVANFVKWAMRTVAMTFIFQSTLDTPLALLALASCWGICLPLHSLKWRRPRSMRQSRPANRIPVLTRARQSSGSHNGSDFPSRFPFGMTSRSSPKSMFAWSDSPTKGLVLLSPDKGPNQNQDYYSTFHNTSTRKRFSKREWEDFTRESTRQAVAEWASSPEFTDWIIENADRISIDRDKSSDNDGGSESDSETSLDNCSGLSFFKWY